LRRESRNGIFMGNEELEREKLELEIRELKRSWFVRPARVTGMCVGQVGINSGPLFPEQELGWYLIPRSRR